MKKLILILVLAVAFTLTAQDKAATDSDNAKDLSNDCMTKISSNSEMRVAVMDMMIEETSGNKEEMMKLVNSIMKNPELYNMIVTMKDTTGKDNPMSFEHRGMMNDNSETDNNDRTKKMKMYKK